MDEYISRVLELETVSKYLHIYAKIITHARDRNSTILKGKIGSKGWIREQLKKELGYVELHHIYPKWFKDVPSYTALDNMIYLTAREHLVAHRCLYNALKSRGAFWALYMMCAMKTRKQCRLSMNGREFEKVRSLHADFMKTLIKHRGNKHHYYGKHRSEETRKKISDSLIGRPLSPETIAKIKANTPKMIGDKHHMWNKKHSDAYKSKMSETCRNVKKTAEWNKKNSESNKGRMMVRNTISGMKKRIPVIDALNLINDGTNMWVKSSSSEGLILIANTITKERARPKREVGLALVESSNGEWIRLAQNKTIPDYAVSSSPASVIVATSS